MEDHNYKILIFIVCASFTFITFAGPSFGMQVALFDAEEQDNNKQLCELNSGNNFKAAFFTPQTQEARLVVVRNFHTIVTAYNSLPEQTDSTPCITADGFNVCSHNTEDVIAANFLPFGTRVRIPDYFGTRVFTVHDRMNERYNNRIDVWMREKSDAKNFGARYLKIEIVKIINTSPEELASK